MKLHYAVEDRPLGTVGSVRQARKILDEPFLVISGDAVTDIDLTRVTDFHRERGADATLTLYRVANPLESGVVITADAGRLLRFQGKPTWGEVLSDTINTGIYVIEPEVMDLVPEGEPFDFANDLFPILLRDGEEEIDPENANIHLRLNMRNLGPVEVGMAFQGDSVSCHFHCEELESVRALEVRSSELAEAIAETGRRVGAIRHSLQRVEIQSEAPQRPMTGRIDTMV